MYPWCVYVCPLEDLHTSQGRSQYFSEVRTTHQMSLSPLYPTPHQGKVTVSLGVYGVYK